MSRVHHVDQAQRIATAVAEGLEGQRLAGVFLARLRCEFLDPDDLHRLIVKAAAASPARLAGLARRLQKGLEAARHAD